MITGPSPIAKLDPKKAHKHPLVKGKKYTIKTSRDKKGNSKMALMIFLFQRGKRNLLLKVDELLPGVKYTIKFKAKANESVLLTYWHRKGAKWIQLDHEKS